MNRFAMRKRFGIEWMSNTDKFLYFESNILSAMSEEGLNEILAEIKADPTLSMASKQELIDLVNWRIPQIAGERESDITPAKIEINPYIGSFYTKRTNKPFGYLKRFAYEDFADKLDDIERRAEELYQQFSEGDMSEEQYSEADDGLNALIDEAEALREQFADDEDVSEIDSTIEVIEGYLEDLDGETEPEEDDAEAETVQSFGRSNTRPHRRFTRRKFGLGDPTPEEWEDMMWEKYWDENPTREAEKRVDDAVQEVYDTAGRWWDNKVRLAKVDDIGVTKTANQFAQEAGDGWWAGFID